ncbi:aminoglycoside phosphotransferase family protein [Streptomyces sp. DSM 41972]|uniref:Aminoglycoside phosphotransferase family protein n=1 Tax=Streptomyces althioticus subsp. attaecolombicae TaxID=3075534 RepID=A0ABU3I147_9ACTN|nr:aminoglycoside phosphotransferase family protein [Streptomyces sp. DSM 41972]SCD63369.1 Predicted kinase, aminoglycoside phosphotransferase (APT) family [Streptomyces sp. di50b]SCE42772.1 Predicted kinase, aminoglycoside phosphotransferase (APT) family [Streptomyces sp. di188]
MTQAPTPTLDTVRRLARSLLEDSGHGTSASAALDVRPAGAGLTTWLVGTRYVLHLAPDRATGVRWRRELRLREVVRPHVSVALPVGVAQGEWAPGLPCTLETRLPGGTAEENTVSAVGETDLAALLTGLNQVPVRQAESLGVPRVPPRSLETLRRAAGEAVELLDKADEFEAARLRQFTQPATVQLAAQAGSAVLVHHALTGGNLAVGADGRVRGVLGWDTAVVGDPAEDIAGLARAVGAPAAVRAATLAGYGARPCLRGLWLARCDCVIHLAEALVHNATASLPLHRTRLRRAWEPIMLERVTDLRDSDAAP